MSLYGSPYREDLLNNCLLHYILNFDPPGLEPNIIIGYSLPPNINFHITIQFPAK